MSVLMTRFSMHVYDSDLSIHVCLSLHTIWHSHYHSLGSSDSPEFSCPDLRVWSLWILLVADQKCAAVAWIISRPSIVLSFLIPYSALEFSFCNSGAPFVLSLLVYLFIFSHLRHIGDAIFM